MRYPWRDVTQMMTKAMHPYRNATTRNAQVPVTLIATNIISTLFNNYLRNNLPREGHFELHANNTIVQYSRQRSFTRFTFIS